MNTPVNSKRYSSLTGRIYKATDGSSDNNAEDNAIPCILTYPLKDLAGDYVRPDGGDWLPFTKYNVINWSHRVPTGRGTHTIKSLTFEGETTPVAVGNSIFFTQPEDYYGVDLTKFDDPNSRNPIGKYAVEEALECAIQSAKLIKADIATGVSIEFTPKHRKGLNLDYWDLDTPSPLEDRPARHFHNWTGYTYAHARTPVNAGCRTLLRDTDDVVTKAIEIAATGRYDGEKLSPLILKAFTDDAELAWKPTWVTSGYDNSTEGVAIETPDVHSPEPTDSDDVILTVDDIPAFQLLTKATTKEALAKVINSNPREMTPRSALADHLEEEGGNAEHIAALKNPESPIYVGHDPETDSVHVYTKPHSIHVEGKRWFSRNRGHTTSSAVSTLKYGPHEVKITHAPQAVYGSHYEWIAQDDLANRNLVPWSDPSESPSRWAKKHGITYTTNVTDVPRERDLKSYEVKGDVEDTLEAVKRNPADKTARLIHADALDEAGEHHLAAIHRYLSDTSNEDYQKNLSDTHTISSDPRSLKEGDTIYSLKHTNTRGNAPGPWRHTVTGKPFPSDTGTDVFKLPVRYPSGYESHINIYPPHWNMMDTASNGYTTEHPDKWYFPVHEEERETRSIDDGRVVKSNVSEKNFHAAIHDDNHDKLHATGYADWLEENGRPAHAEIVRKNLEDYDDSGSMMLGSRFAKEEHPPGIQHAFVTAHNFGSDDGPDEYSVNLEQKSLHSPKHTITWGAYKLPGSQAHTLLSKLKNEGANVSDYHEHSLARLTRLYGPLDEPNNEIKSIDDVTEQLQRWITENESKSLDIPALKKEAHALSSKAYLATKAAESPRNFVESASDAQHYANIGEHANAAEGHDETIGYHQRLIGRMGDNTFFAKSKPYHEAAIEAHREAGGLHRILAVHNDNVDSNEHTLTPEDIL